MVRCLSNASLRIPPDTRAACCATQSSSSTGGVEGVPSVTALSPHEGPRSLSAGSQRPILFCSRRSLGQKALDLRSISRDEGLEEAGVVVLVANHPAPVEDEAGRQHFHLELALDESGSPADQNRKGHLRFPDERRDPARSLAHGIRVDLEAPRTVFLEEALIHRQRIPAWLAPSRPDVEQYDAPSILRQIVQLAAGKQRQLQLQRPLGLCGAGR